MRPLRILPFQALSTDRLLLRELRADDAPALFALRSDPRVMQYIGRPMATALVDAEALIAMMAADLQEENGITWAITATGSDVLIGTIGYYRLKKEHFRGEVGYMLAVDHWGRGLMGEALDVVVQHGFDVIGLHSIEAITDPENVASNALLERHGFTREGLFKEDYFWNGRFCDSAHWGRLAPGS